MTPVEMPKANENLTEATLEHWSVKEGQSVQKDQTLCEIITDKAKFDMPSPALGVVLKILAPERALLPVGYCLCLLGESTESIETIKSTVENLSQKNERLLKDHHGATTSISATTPLVTDATQSNSPPITSNAIRATPTARRIAKEHGVDLAAVVLKYTLTAPVGEKDVLRFISEKQ